MKPGAVDVSKAVCVRFGVGPKSLHGPSLARRVTEPRQIAMFLTKEMTGLSLQMVARAFGRTNHSTVTHAVDRISAAVEADPEMAMYVAQCRGMAMGYAEERIRKEQVYAARAAAGDLVLTDADPMAWRIQPALPGIGVPAE